jgi:hypothetical protein
MDAKDVSLEQRIAAHQASKPDRVNALPAMPVEEPARSAEACRRVLAKFSNLNDTNVAQFHDGTALIVKC